MYEKRKDETPKRIFEEKTKEEEEREDKK